MDFKLFSHFVAVAEEMHVARAAEKLGIAQPSLSQQIQQLERQLGTLLFSRESRRLSLTAEGEVFLKEARLTLQQATHAIQTVKRMGRGELGQLQLGYVDSALVGAATFNPLNEFKASNPDVELMLEGGNVMHQVAAVSDGKLDAAVIRGPLPLLSRKLRCEEFAREELLVCLPQGHKLQQRRAIPAQALRDESFVTPFDPSGVGLAGQISQICQEAGFVPRISQRVGQTLSIASLVAAGFGISLLPAQLSKLLPGDLAFKPLETPAWSPLYMISDAHEQRRVVLSFLDSWRNYERKNVLEMRGRRMTGPARGIKQTDGA